MLRSITRSISLAKASSAPVASSSSSSTASTCRFKRNLALSASRLQTTDEKTDGTKAKKLSHEESVRLNIDRYYGDFESPVPREVVEDRDRALTYDETSRDSDFISFDHSRHIPAELEDEAIKFDEWVKDFGDCRFDSERPAEVIDDGVEFTVSRDPEEWKAVEALFPPKLKAKLPEQGNFASGFKLPTAKYGDHPYYVKRTTNNMLPVYVRLQGAKHHRNILYTQIKKCDGDLWAFKKDIDDFLKQRYNMDFVCQVAEVTSSLRYRGDFEADFKEFLLAKGF